VLAWVNDDDTKRAYESGNEAYRVFRKMLESGQPPDDWNQLLAECQHAGQADFAGRPIEATPRGAAI
jgi:toxin YhaV